MSEYTPNLQEENNLPREGRIEEFDSISLNLSDDDIARAIGNRVDFAKKWWNKAEDLENVQKKAERVWLNLGSSDIDLYDFQESYTENLIFTNIETLISQVLGRPPQPMATEAQDTDASRDLAQMVEKVLLSYYHNTYQRAKLEMIARHLLTGFRYAIAKPTWNSQIGRLKPNGKRAGAIELNTVRPDKVIFDAAATDKDNIPLIAEYLEAPHEELCNKYPDKASDIMQSLGLSYGTKSQTTDLTTYLEVHFTGWRPDNGKEYEGIAWKLNHIVLDSMKNPNYDYDEFHKGANGEIIYNNFFDKPKKPYVIFNYLNQGKYIVDSTSLTEQTWQLQRQLEKRGRQIDQNADMANAGFAYDTTKITEEVMAKMIGDPDERVGVKGDPSKAITRVPPNTLEEYVIQDKVDIRTALNNLWGVNNPLLGEKSGNPTLGQDELSIQRNSSRLGTLSTALENGMDRVYKYEVQLLKVFMTEPQDIKYSKPGEATEHINFYNENIESGISLIVKEGSLLPDDPSTKLQEAKEFAPLFDPLTLSEYLSVDNPKETAKRIFLMHSDPGAYGEEYLGIKQQGNHDPDAVNAIQQISQGQTPPVPQSPSNNYVNQLQAHMASPAFGQMSPIAQEQLRQHAKAIATNAHNVLGTSPQQTPGMMPQVSNQQKKPGLLGKFGKAVNKTLFK